MSRVGEDVLTEYVLGTLPEAERVRIEAALGHDRALAAEVAAIAEALGALTDALPPAAPAPDRRALLLGAATRRPRFERLLDRVAKLFDLGLEGARRLLDSVDDPAVWSPSGLPRVHFLHLQGGPAIAGADAGIVRIEAGAAFPYHGHTGRERVLFLQGACRVPELGGRVLRAGDDDFVDDTSFAHELVALPGPDVLYAAVLFGQVTFPERA